LALVWVSANLNGPTLFNEWTVRIERPEPNFAADTMRPSELPERDSHRSYRLDVETGSTIRPLCVIDHGLDRPNGTSLPPDHSTSIVFGNSNEQAGLATSLRVDDVNYLRLTHDGLNEVFRQLGYHFRLARSVRVISTKLADQACHGIRWLCTDRQPMVKSVEFKPQICGFRHRIVCPHLLEKTAISAHAGISCHNAVIRTLFRTKTLKSKFDRHWPTLSLVR